MTNSELKLLLQSKDKHYPISDAYNSTHGQKRNVFWDNQKDHLLPWLDSQATTGSGTFTRTRPNTDAATMYAHLSCPEALLWLAEAAGVDAESVQEAAYAAQKIDCVVSRAAEIRRHIPWITVEAALLAA